MKIALLTDGIHPYVIGGMQRHSFYLAKYLALNNIYVDLYHLNKSKYDISNLEFFSNDEKKFINSLVVDFPDFGNLPGHYLRESYEYSKRIFDLFIKNSNVDFIYVKGFCGWKLIEEKRKGYKCAPVGIKFHGMNMFQKPPSFRGRLEQIMFRPAVKFNMKNSDYVFSYGGKISDIIHSIGVQDSKIIESPAGIEEEWLTNNVKIQNHVRKFLYVGRYERLKGIQELSEAIMDINEKEKFEFHFVGPIPEELKIKNKNILYYGEISERAEILKIMDSCDILVLPSYSEGMPNVILEAMARMLAIIATDVGAVNKMVSQENGWLIDSPEPQRIKSAIVSAMNISDADLSKRKQASLKKVTENFIWKQIIKKLIGEISRTFES